MVADASPGVEVHGTCVALGAVGVLLRGAPGAGKSDLALRLVEAGARLVADDRVRIGCRGGALLASAPEALAGLIEVRGVGIVRLEPARWTASAALGLVCDLAAPEAVERLPEPARAEILGVALPLLRLDPFSASAAAKLRIMAGSGLGAVAVGA